MLSCSRIAFKLEVACGLLLSERVFFVFLMIHVYTYGIIIRDGFSSALISVPVSFSLGICIEEERMMLGVFFEDFVEMLFARPSP